MSDDRPIAIDLYACASGSGVGRKPTVLSLFSGVGGFDLGLERAGFEVVAQCDNDPFCNKVLSKHWPGVRRFDDVRSIGLGRTQRDVPGKSDNTQVRGASPEWRGGDVDLICGGFPCQDLSVAGKRAGLDGARSGLWFEFHRILSELRPTFCLIENVPGLLSSNSGRDFGIVLAGLGELWPAVGWAVLDSQHFGVPQRRRRVYIVGGPSRASVQQILSLCESGDWNTQASRAEREDVAGTLAAGAHPSGFNGQDAYNGHLVTAHALRAQSQLAHREDVDTYITHSLRADGFDASEDGTGRGTPLVSVRTANTGANGHGIAEDIAHTLDGVNGQAVAFTERTRNGERNFEASEELSYALTNPGSGGRTHSRQLYDGMGVRRLTPVECERLQGFPDDWTKLDDKTPDGPRYKALGNAVTVPVIEYLGHRILMALPKAPSVAGAS